MPGGRHRTEDSHQTTGASNGTLTKAESEDRDSIGRWVTDDFGARP
jgi:hypothetical protein